MLLLDVEPILSLAVLVVWVGSLVLVSGQPPEAPQTVVKESVSLDSMRDLIENSATPVLVTDKNTIAIANAAARRVMGRHMLGQDARVTFRQPEAIALLNSNRNGRAIVRGLVRRQDIWEINRQAVDEQMAVIELINQTAEADISRAHTDFVANASHELRTPTSKKFLNTIESEGKRLQSLISDLMSLSRVEAEKHDLPRELIALGPLVERAASDAAGPDRSQRLDLDLDRDLNVRGDRQQLEQLVRNLVDNALKYGNPDSPVKVALAVSRDKQARLSVVDEGEGISAEHVPHLTRRFYRTDPGRSRASGGTGLGLAIVKHIVERHRGRLDIESDLGKGTRVTVRLPLAESEGNDALPPGKGDKAPATPELS